MAGPKKPSKNKQPRRKTRRLPKPVKWIAGAAGVAALAYGVSQMSGVAYGEDALRVVDFTVLTAQQKNTALEAANRARCICGCGLGLAQCVATDSTCPIRESNIDRIKRMVDQAKGT